jgi:long-chain acyl-CoA synthetase
MIEQVMLTGQDLRGLKAIVVLNPEKVASAGFLDDAMGAQLMKQYDQINNPQCAEEDCKEGCAALQKASEQLISNVSLIKAVEKDVNKATASFRKWEQVGQIYVTLEPFAMANGLLTQSYKVKRDLVFKKYESVIR